MPFTSSDGESFDNIDDFFDHLDKEWKEKPLHYRFRVISGRIIKEIWWTINPKSIYRRLRARYHRMTRGWAESDAWGFDWYLAKIIADGVSYLKENKHGWPGDDIITIEDFDAELQKIIDGFNHYHDISLNCESDCCNERYCFPDKCPIVISGFEAFQKWYTSLWD